jgi:hypothetical protein
VVLVLYWDGSKKARPSFNRGDREEWQAVKACIAWLNTDGKALLPATFVPPPLDLKYYRTGRQPVVFGREPALAYYANGDSVSRFLYLDMRDRMSVVEFCRQQGIQFVAWSPKLATDVPELARLDALPPEFVVLYDEWRGIRNSVVILGFLPNLRGAVPGHASRNLPAPGDESAKVLAPPGSTRPPAASNSRNALQPPLEFAASQTTFDLCG